MSHQSLKKDQSSLAIVTGRTTGIGLALAQRFAEKGYEVTSVGLGEMPKNQERIEFHPMDVRSQESIKNLLKTHDHLDVLVNAAGAIRREEELKPEVFETIVDINLNGTMRMCAECRPLLAQSRGSIINIASMLSYFGGGLVPGYSASKGGVAQLTKSLAIAYAVDEIRVNALAPGWIITPMTSELRSNDLRNKAILERTPLGRWGEPSELVGPAIFLASKQASFVTGTLLNVDGGYAAM